MTFPNPAFERWYKAHVGRSLDKAGAQYLHPITQCCWLTWKAAHAKVKQQYRLRLPEAYPPEMAALDPMSKGWNSLREEILRLNKTNIEKHGYEPIRYEPKKPE